MDFKYKDKNKEMELNTDVERMAEKVIDTQQKDWKEKFNIKHKARKEILKIKHKQKLERQFNKQNKTNFIKTIEDSKLKKAQMEMEAKIRLEELKLEEKQREISLKKFFTILIIILLLPLIIMAIILGINSRNPNLFVDMLLIIGMISMIIIYAIWINNKKN